MVKSFSITQSQIFATSPICRPNTNRLQHCYLYGSICFSKIVLYKVLIKLSSVLSGRICFDIILRQAKTFKCCSITSFIRFKDALVLYSKMKSFRRTRALESKNVNKHWRFCTLQWPCRSWM